MQKLRAVLSVTLCMLLCLSCFSPVVFAQREYEIVVEAPDDNESILVPENVSDIVDWDGVFALVKTAVSDHADTVDLTAFNIPFSGDSSDPNKQYISNFLFYEPSLLRAVTKYSMGYRTSGGRNYFTTLYFVKDGVSYYNFDEQAYRSRLAGCEDAMTQILFGIKDNALLSDLQKCILLHDRLAAWCGYDIENLYAHTVPKESYSAYGPLVLHIGVCQGYAMAYGWMLDQLGIENYYTSSEEIDHGWNMVYLDQAPYYVDVTWDDPTWDLYGNVNHSNLLQSYDTFSLNHGATDFPEDPVSTQYENAAWVSGFAEMQLIGGSIYYMDGSAYWQQSDGDSGFILNRADLKRLDLQSGTSSRIVTLNGIGNTYNAVFIPGQDESYSNVYTRLASIGEKLFYSTGTEIRVYDTETGADESFYAPDLTQYAPDSRIYGFTQRNGTFYISISGSPSVDNSENIGTVETVPYCEHDNKVTLETITPATCSVGGEIKYICADCRALATAQTEPDPALHVFGDWETVTAATCVAEGSERRDCANCDAFETRETAVDPANHVNTENRDAVAATCTEKGRKAGVYCTDCKKYVSGGAETATDPNAHDFGEWTTVSAGACTVRGTERRDCSRCDAFETRETAVDPANHVNTENRDAVAATCTREGCEAGVYCLDCKQYVSGGAALGKLPHTYVAVVVAPTCTKKGYTTYRCSSCADSYTADETAALGHIDADGDQRCDRCNADLSPEANCSCNCHKGGLLGFFFKIKVFFWKLFNMTQYRYCECGKAHW